MIRFIWYKLFLNTIIVNMYYLTAEWRHINNMKMILADEVGELHSILLISIQCRNPTL